MLIEKKKQKKTLVLLRAARKAKKHRPLGESLPNTTTYRRWRAFPHTTSFVMFYFDMKELDKVREKSVDTRRRSLIYTNTNRRRTSPHIAKLVCHFKGDMATNVLFFQSDFVYIGLCFSTFLIFCYHLSSVFVHWYRRINGIMN